MTRWKGSEHSATRVVNENAKGAQVGKPITASRTTTTSCVYTTLIDPDTDKA